MPVVGKVGIGIVAVLATSLAATTVAVEAVSQPTLSWVAKSLKVNSSARVSELVMTSSKGAQRWSATGACSVTGTRVNTKGVGSCTLTVAIARAAGSRALTTTKSLPVMKEVTLDVLAAASLASAFDTLAGRFTLERRHVKMVMSYAGSSTLAAQIAQGASFDAVAMADQSTMAKVVSAGFVDSASVKIFAMNRLAILVAKGNPLRIRTLADVTNPSISLSLCDPAQPCGKYAGQMFTAAGLTAKPMTLETSAAAVVSRVAKGEVDAGIAYASDGASAKGVTAVTIPVAQNVIAKYPVGLATSMTGTRESAAKLFKSFLLSSSAASVLTGIGFIVP